MAEHSRKTVIQRGAIFLGFLLLIAGVALYTHTTETNTAGATRPEGLQPCATALAESPAGSLESITEAKAKAAKSETPGAWELLGWRYVEAARRTRDPGYYRLAESAADCLSQKDPGNSSAKLLKGHILQSLHRFAEAETIARELTQQRGLPYDYGLLGDALMEQGRLADAAQAYQRMIDLKPSLESYARAAHLRWLYGDLDGAIELMTLAAKAGSPRAAEPTAWAWSRLADYLFQKGREKLAAEAVQTALSYAPNYPPAQLIQGRLLLSENRFEEAAEILGEAAAREPLPEFQWALAEALRAANRPAEARDVEETLERLGAVEDPRTASLYFAGRGQKPAQALRLAQAELKIRQDVFTFGALAWAQHASGHTDQALEAAEKSLAEGTRDGRLLLHAGVIAAAAGRHQSARNWLDQAGSLAHTLLPSERDLLREARDALPATNSTT